jgi:hypothetical protein
MLCKPRLVGQSSPVIGSKQNQHVLLPNPLVFEKSILDQTSNALIWRLGAGSAKQGQPTAIITQEGYLDPMLLKSFGQQLLILNSRDREQTELAFMSSLAHCIKKSGSLM